MVFVTQYQAQFAPSTYIYLVFTKATFPENNKARQNITISAVSEWRIRIPSAHSS
jgi:hypothetical protein